MTVRSLSFTSPAETASVENPTRCVVMSRVSGRASPFGPAPMRRRGSLIPGRAAGGRAPATALIAGGASDGGECGEDEDEREQATHVFLLTREAGRRSSSGGVLRRRTWRNRG